MTQSLANNDPSDMWHPCLPFCVWQRLSRHSTRKPEAAFVLWMSYLFLKERAINNTHTRMMSFNRTTSLGVGLGGRRTEEGLSVIVASLHLSLFCFFLFVLSYRSSADFYSLFFLVRIYIFRFVSLCFRFFFLRWSIFIFVLFIYAVLEPGILALHSKYYSLHY